MYELEEKVFKQLPKKRTKYEGEKLTYFIPKKYIPDFIIHTKAGKIYLEVKGYLRYEDQVKMRAVKASNPDLDIRFYFPEDKKVAGSQMLNSEWCIKWNFPYCIGNVPKGWLSDV